MRPFSFGVTHMAEETTESAPVETSESTEPIGDVETTSETEGQQAEESPDSE